RAREDPVRGRLRRPRERREPRDPRARRRAIRGIACEFPRAACYPQGLKSRGGPVPHLLGGSRVGFNRVARFRWNGPLHAAAFLCLQTKTVQAKRGGVSPTW